MSNEPTIPSQPGARELLEATGMSPQQADEVLIALTRRIVAAQRRAHDTNRPHFHMGLPCKPEYRCGVTAIIDLIDPDKKESF